MPHTVQPPQQTIINAASGSTITFDPEKLRLLKSYYLQAQSDNAESFVFLGHELLTAYAKYLIEYLEGRFK